MAHCVNRSSEEFKTLAEQSNINPVILAAKVSLWQEQNGLDNFPALNDIVEVKSSVASKETVEQMKKVAEQMGVNLIALDEYIKGNPDVDVKGVNGLADLLKGVIAIAQGKENVAITEEVVHVATSIIEQVNPKLVTELISKIDRFSIYNQVLQQYKGKKAYQLPDGRPNIRKIKKEAVDKLISELIVNASQGSEQFPELASEENRNLVQRMWDAILDFIKGMYKKSDIDIFKQTAESVRQGEIVGTISDITSEEIFFQVEENEKVNKVYDSFKDMDSRMNLVDANENEKRHYTYDGKELEFTVTSKDKKELNRTPEEKMVDDQKKEWGSEGHKYLENYISVNLINKDGYKLASPTEIEITSPIDEKLKSKIRTFAKELIASYKDGTRFMLETQVANLKVKGGMGSTIDFVAIEPVENSKGEPDVKVDILDWKFTTVNTERNDDIPFYKQKDWKKQMGEYTKIAYNLGVERNQLRKARMVPFIVNYKYAIKGDKKSSLIPGSVEIGKLDSTQETNLYLLPVPVDFESTGNESVDKLISSLRKLYEKIYISYAKPEEKFSKKLKLEELSQAIRNLHLKLNFSPIYNVAETFLKDAKETLKEFENVDFSKVSKEELLTKLQKLQEYQKSANQFLNLDNIYLSHISKENMSAEEKKLLKDFERVTASTKRMLEQINSIQQEYVINLALEEGIVEEDSVDEILEAEKAVSALDRNFLEGSKLSPKIIRLATKIMLKAKNLISIAFTKSANDYGKVLLPLEEEARAKGVSAFSMIGRMTERGPRLIKKLDSDFLNKIRIAREKGDKQFLLDNLNVEKYKELTNPIIEKGLEELNKTQFSEDLVTDTQIRDIRKKNLKNSLDITSEGFNGFDEYSFRYYYRQAMIEEGHYSKDYMEMSKSENALRVWNFFTALNEKARSMGYLDKEGLSFFPLIEATTLQKMNQSGKILSETKDFFKDMYTINPNEGQLFAKVDDETGEVKKSIPKYFTRTNKTTDQLSTDLNKVGLMWIKSLMEYESAKDLEFSLMTMHAVEQTKGSLITDSKGNIIFEGNKAKVNKDENKNADVLQVIMDDYLYGIGENLDGLGNILLTSTVGKLSKNDEKTEDYAISTKKALKTGDVFVRTLALGLKPLVGLANWAGTQMQAYISSGGMYNFGEFEKNNIKVTLPFGKGLSLIERALLDTITPLTGDNPLEIQQRRIAAKQSWTSYLNSWSFSDVMMITNSFGEKRLELANAMSMIDNSMVIDGKIVNIRQYLRAQDRAAKKGMAYEQRRQLEKSFDSRVNELKESDNALKNLAKIENDELVIPGVSMGELANFRMSIIDNARNLNGQMSSDDKMGYRRDTIFNSFMMFKGWIPKLLSVRWKNITKNEVTSDWEYGRYRAFGETLFQIGFRNIMDLRDVILGTDKGLEIINQMLEEKKQQYYLQTGKELKITPEEYQELIRSQIVNMMKELKVIVGILGLLIASKIVAPDDDDDDLTKNRYKYFAKAINKISDELLFYVNPASADEMTKGSVIPSLGLLSKVGSLLNATRKEIYYDISGDEKGADKTYPMKYFINLIPIGSQFQNEVLPLIDPELAKEMGVRVSAEARRR